MPVPRRTPFLSTYPRDLPITGGMTLFLGFYLSIFVAGWLTIGALQRESRGGGTRSFAVFGVIIACWSIGELLVLEADTPEQITLARRMLFLGAAGLPPTWFWLGAQAARPRWFIAKPRRVALAFVVPLFFYSCLYGDQSMRFVDWTSSQPRHGPWFDLFTTYQYALSLIGTGFFLRAALRLGRSSIEVMSVLSAGVALPIGVNIAYYVGWLATDWTAASLGPAAILIWLSAVESGLASRLPEEHYDVIEQLDVGVIVADPDGRIVSANGAAVRLSDLGELRGRLLPEAVAAAEQRPEVMIESRGIALHGRFGITGHALILTDRTEAETARRRVELGGRLEALGSLTAGIAHEVNNPLAFIQANLSSLENTAKQLSEPEILAVLPTTAHFAIDDFAAVIEETQEGVERIRLLVQRLKTFSRAPDLTATAVDVDLARVAHQAAAIASIGQEGTPIRIEGESSVRILTIETAVFQILVNLLLNAVQAQPKGLNVQVEMMEQDQGVCARVSDDGPGIAPALLPRIFDPFFTTKAGGTGLGLSLSYDLATQLGGHLSAANQENGGAVFELWLPAVPPSTSPAAVGANDELRETPSSMA